MAVAVGTAFVGTGVVVVAVGVKGTLVAVGAAAVVVVAVGARGTLVAVATVPDSVRIAVSGADDDWQAAKISREDAMKTSMLSIGSVTPAVK